MRSSEDRIHPRAQEVASAAVAPALCDVATLNRAAFTFEVRDRAGATPLTAEQRTAALAALAAVDGGAAASDAWATGQKRGEAKVQYDGLAKEGKILRAVVLVTLDEVNTLRQWLASFKAEVAASTSLADLKTRVAGLPNTPDRTGAQARTAIRNRIDNGSADAPP